MQPLPPALGVPSYLVMDLMLPRIARQGEKGPHTLMLVLHVALHSTWFD